MTIDEAITKHKEKAKRYRILADSDELVQKSYCAEFDKYQYEKLVKENEQLAEWLEELELLREEKKEFQIIARDNYEMGYNKAIDDFLEKIQWEYLNGCGIKQSEIEFLVNVSSEVAGQLKAGDNNGIRKGF